MSAMIEGMAGVRDGPLSQVLSHPVLAPRWDLGEARSIRVCVRYPASGGYVAYLLSNDPKLRKVSISVTGSASSMIGRFLLPPGIDSAKSVEVDGAAAPYRIERVDHSSYVDLDLGTTAVRTVGISY
jgi:hypothetical protein